MTDQELYEILGYQPKSFAEGGFTNEQVASYIRDNKLDAAGAQQAAQSFGVSPEQLAAAQAILSSGNLSGVNAATQAYKAAATPAQDAANRDFAAQQGLAVAPAFDQAAQDRLAAQFKPLFTNPAAQQATTATPAATSITKTLDNAGLVNTATAPAAITTATPAKSTVTSGGSTQIVERNAIVPVGDGTFKTPNGNIVDANGQPITKAATNITQTLDNAGLVSTEPSVLTVQDATTGRMVEDQSGEGTGSVFQAYTPAEAALYNKPIPKPIGGPEGATLVPMIGSAQTTTGAGDNVEVTSGSPQLTGYAATIGNMHYYYKPDGTFLYSKPVQTTLQQAQPLINMGVMALTAGLGGGLTNLISQNLGVSTTIAKALGDIAIGTLTNGGDVEKALKGAALGYGLNLGADQISKTLNQAFQDGGMSAADAAAATKAAIKAGTSVATAAASGSNIPQSILTAGLGAATSWAADQSGLTGPAKAVFTNTLNATLRGKDISVPGVFMAAMEGAKTAATGKSASTGTGGDVVSTLLASGDDSLDTLTDAQIANLVGGYKGVSTGDGTQLAAGEGFTLDGAGTKNYVPIQNIDKNNSVITSAAEKLNSVVEANGVPPGANISPVYMTTRVGDLIGEDENGDDVFDKDYFTYGTQVSATGVDGLQTGYQIVYIPNSDGTYQVRYEYNNTDPATGTKYIRQSSKPPVFDEKTNSFIGSPVTTPSVTATDDTADRVSEITGDTVTGDGSLSDLVEGTVTPSGAVTNVTADSGAASDTLVDALTKDSTTLTDADLANIITNSTVTSSTGFTPGASDTPIGEVSTVTGGSGSVDGGGESVDGGSGSVTGGSGSVDGGDGTASVDGGVSTVDGGVSTVDGGVSTLDGGDGDDTVDGGVSTLDGGDGDDTVNGGDCKTGYIKNSSGECVLDKTCGTGYEWDETAGKCVRKKIKEENCDPGYVKDSKGNCVLDKTCKTGYEWDEAAGKCVKIKEEPPSKECPPGQIKDENGKCYTPIDKPPPPKPCPEGQSRNAAGVCVPIVKPPPPKKCPPGQVKDADGNCVPIVELPSTETGGGEPGYKPGDVVKAREGAAKDESEDTLEELLAALEGREPVRKSKQKAGEKAKMATGGTVKHGCGCKKCEEKKPDTTVNDLLASLGFNEYSGGSMDDLLKTIR